MEQIQTSDARSRVRFGAGQWQLLHHMNLFGLLPQPAHSCPASAALARRLRELGSKWLVRLLAEQILIVLVGRRGQASQVVIWSVSGELKSCPKVGSNKF